MKTSGPPAGLLRRRNGADSNGRAPFRARLSAAAGFSLVEVLIVISIIAFLTAAIVAVLPRVQNAAKISATKATIKKVDEMLNDRINGFRRWIQTQDKQAGTASPSYVDQSTLQQAGGSVALAKVLAIKKQFRRNFVQSFTELSLPSWTSGTTFAVGALIRPTKSGTTTFRCTVSTAPGKSGNSEPSWPTTAGQTVGDSNLTWQLVSVDPTTESAACLYMILSQAAIFDTEPPSAADLRAIETADTDGDGIPEIVDAWGHPLRFYRWPTRLVRPSPDPTTAQSLTSGTSYTIPVEPQYPPPFSSSVAGLSAKLLISSISMPSPYPTAFADEKLPNQPLAKDPDDPLGLILAAMLLQPTAPDPATEFESNKNTAATAPINYFHTPDTYFVPLIVSMGPDEQLGLYEPCDTPVSPYPTTSTTTNHGYIAQPKTNVALTDPSGLNALLDNITNHQ